MIFCIRGLAPISAMFLLLTASSVGFSADDAKQPITAAVAIQVGPKPTEVERYAADELARYLDKLFHIKTRPTSAAPKSARTILLVGNPRSNPAVAAALANGGLPRVSEQGIVLKAGRLEGRPALVIGGGSPAATLWAVYELVERWGVRYLLHGDVLPEKAGPFRLPEADVVLEPNLKVRQWRVIDCLACGPECWGLADYRRIIDQLAKLRFNRIFAEIYTYSPYIDLEVKGIRRKSASLWFNWHYPISDDMPGRRLFGKAEEFWNPDLPRGGSYAEMAAAARRLLRGIFEHAQRRGMQCALGATLTEFPVEFAPLLHDSEEVILPGAKTVAPGAKTRPDDPAVTELASATLRSILDAYPQVDYLLLGMPEHRQWVDHYKQAWQTLDRKYRLSEAANLESVLAAAAKRTGYPGGAKRAVREVKGDIVSLYFYDRLLTDGQTLKHTRRPDVKIILNCAAEELFPVLPKLLPPGSETMNFVDYTPARIVKRLDALGRIPARQMPTTLIYTLHDDNVVTVNKSPSLARWLRWNLSTIDRGLGGFQQWRRRRAGSVSGFGGS